MTRLAQTMVIVLMTACGAAEVADTTTTPAPASTTTPIATTTTSAVETSTTEASELPGEPVEFGPVSGDIVAVIGVAHDDVLNLRSAPGADEMILEGIPPLYDALAALGETRQLPGAMWIAVDYEGTEGWVNLRYVAYLGATTDVTASIIDRLGETPSAGSMEDLGLLLVESLTDEEPALDVVISGEPDEGDLGEITLDLIGSEDDAVSGGRWHIFGQPEAGAFVLKTIEATTFCSRGVTDDGFCI